MRKTIGKRFKCLKNVVRIIVVRVLRSFRHNLGYDLGNPRATNVGAGGQNTVDTIEQYPTPSDKCRDLPNRVERHPTSCGYGRTIQQSYDIFSKENASKIA
jgi:hypothetical protein